MEGEVYWYYLNGRLKQHLNPPSDPSSVTFATIRTHDIGYRRVQAEIILCIEGTYMKPKNFTSSPYDTPKQFRETVEEYVKKSLTDQRRITDWTDKKERKPKKSKPVINCKCK
jgi:hypothetical protein